MLNPSIAYGKNKAMSYTIAENNLEQPSSLVTQQSASDTNQASFKNIALPSITQSTNLTSIFKKVEILLFKSQLKHRTLICKLL
jgi:hypothetical protein